MQPQTFPWPSFKVVRIFRPMTAIAEWLLQSKKTVTKFYPLFHSTMVVDQIFVLFWKLVILFKRKAVTLHWSFLHAYHTLSKKAFRKRPKPPIVSLRTHEQNTVARLTRFEGRAHIKFPKGPPFAHVFWKKFPRVPPLLTFFENIPKGPLFAQVFLKKILKGPLFAHVFWKNFLWLCKFKPKRLVMSFVHGIDTVSITRPRFSPPSEFAVNQQALVRTHD